MQPRSEFRHNRYQLFEVLGVGTTSTVYRAIDIEAGEERAIKLLSPAMGMHEAMRERFLREAAMTARLKHPNMVLLHDVGSSEGHLFLVMDLVRGSTLEEHVELKGPIAARHAASIIQQALHALHYAHAQGVVHRDITPGNIMLTDDGVPKVVDFGIGRMLGRDPRVSTDPGSVLGTWGYMAPEQGIDSGQVDNRTDIYAVGATLYAILTGRRPDKLFRADDSPAFWEGVPAPLVPVIRKATRYQPDERYQTAAEMAEAVAEAHERLPPLNPEEEATIVLKPAASEDTVRRKQINLSNLVPPEEAADERRRRRQEGRRMREIEEAPTLQVERPGLPPRPKTSPAPEEPTPWKKPLLVLAGALLLALLAWWLLS